MVRGFHLDRFNRRIDERPEWRTFGPAPDHFKQFTVIGILLMAILGGIGGVTRDVLVSEVPSALANPAYLVLCVIFGIVGYNLA